jgi:glycosyltransferase involved in cell wall biosynthesis
MSKLSVVVPIFNEERHLRQVLTHLFRSQCPVERQWILVDDCSSDRSLAILRELQPELGFELVSLPSNQGKGAAVRAGIARATGELIMIQDADFEYDPRDVVALLQPLLEDSADVVYGSRFSKGNLQVHRTYHYFVNWLLTTLSNLLSGLYLSDMETCYKIFRADLLKSMKLKSNRFGIEVELTAYVAKSAARTFELPIRYYPRTYLQGKKIGWKDGLAALFHLVYFNLVVGREQAFEGLARRYLPGELRGPLELPA